MPWEVSSVMDERMSFIVAWQSGEDTVAELARQFQISRKTAYKMIDRFETMGWDGLKDLSRAPYHHPNAVSEETLAAAVAQQGTASTVAGGEHDRRDPGPQRLGAAPPSSGEGAGAPGSAGRHRGRERRVGGGFQGLVPHRRRTALRTLLLERLGEPLRAASAGMGTDAAGARLGVAGCGVSRVRLAEAAAQRQWPALCQHGAGRLVGAGGAADQGGRGPRTHHAGSPARERPARADASYAEGRHGDAASRRSASAATALRSVPPGLQRGATARSIGTDAAGDALQRLAAALQRTAARAGISRRPQRAPCACARRDQVGRRTRVHQRSADPRTYRPRADR